MRARHAARQAARVQRNAELCGVPLPEWTALTRAERRRLLSKAQKQPNVIYGCAYCAAAEGKPHADGCPKTGIYSPAVRRG